MIKKLLQPTFEKIDAINSKATFILHTDNELLNGYEVEIEKKNNGFKALINFKPYKGFSSSQLNAIKFESPIKIQYNSSEYYLPENSLLLNNYSFDFNEDEPLVEITGGISQISSAINDETFNEKYLRLIIPIHKSSHNMRDIQGWTYESDIAATEKLLQKVVINEIEYHFFSFKHKENSYLAVDTTQQFTIEEFRKLSHSILLGFGFLFGDLFLDEGYILSSDKENFSKVENIHFSTYRETMLTGMRIYTTNPFSVYNVTGKSRSEIEVRVKKIKEWYEKVVEIQPHWFSKLCELFYNYEPISRAAIITLQGNLFALEMKGSAYSAALEAITGEILKQHSVKFPKPMEKQEFKELRDDILDILNNKLPTSNPDNDTPRNILSERIKNLNSPTNASKLQKSFDVLGYVIKDYELEAIKARDKFQHGKLPVDEISDNSVFSQVYGICLILHRLIYTLVLKQVDFEGYIINYPQLHSHITQKDLNEDMFYKI